MKKVMKKRSAWQVFLWGLRHPVLWNRMIAIQELRRKRILRRFIYEDYDQMKKILDGKNVKEKGRRRSKSYGRRPSSTLFDTLFPQ